MTVPDPMLAVVPIRCPSGHYLRDHVTWIPGAIIRGWDSSCSCGGARSRGTPYGHAYLLCAACLDEGHEVEWREPPCPAAALR